LHDDYRRGDVLGPANVGEMEAQWMSDQVRREGLLAAFG
jgi:hypothetical protein